MRNAIKDLEKQQVNGYVLDLRSNPGGLLYASIEIARMWINDGAIVSTVDRQGETDRQQANNRALTNQPLVVLVDGVLLVPVKSFLEPCKIINEQLW
jgi:carboxyl-terminal processing protease